ncbi:MAG: hotdog fold thioesterase [Alphaproteobacteria bacterium]|nr:hotdog fold thioesterase [Alphaproteobacteria bacterium]
MTDTPDPEILVARLLERDALASLLGVELIEAELGRCVLRMTVRPEHLNGYGGGHGGILFSLADIAFAMASNSRGHIAVGINASISYFVGTKEGDVLYARAVELNRSRRLGSYRIDVERADGTLVAAFTGTVHITEKPVA